MEGIFASASSSLTGQFIDKQFQNLSGGACHPNNRFDQSESSSVTHAFLYPIYSLAIADQHMSGRPSCITLKCGKKP